MLKLGPLFKISRQIVKKGISEIQNLAHGSPEALGLSSKGSDPVMRLSKAFAQISIVEPASVLMPLKKNEVTFSYHQRSYSTHRSLNPLENSQNDNNALVHKLGLEEVLNLLSKVGIYRGKVAMDACSVKDRYGVIHSPFVEYESSYLRPVWTDTKHFKSFTIKDSKDITARAHVEHIDPAGSISFIIELVNSKNEAIFSQSGLKLYKFWGDIPVTFNEDDMLILSKIPPIPDSNKSQRNKYK